MVHWNITRIHKIHNPIGPGVGTVPCAVSLVQDSWPSIAICGTYSHPFSWKLSHSWSMHAEIPPPGYPQGIPPGDTPRGTPHTHYSTLLIVLRLTHTHHIWGGVVIIIHGQQNALLRIKQELVTHTQ